MLDGAAEAELREAHRLIEIGQYARVREICAAVASRYPEAGEPHLTLAALRLRRMAPRKALESLEAFLQRSPLTAMSEGLRGEALTQLREPGEALAAVEHALRLAPDDAETFIVIGAVFNACNRAEQAIACFREAFARDPEASRMRLASALHTAGAFAEADVLHREALKRDPSLALAWFSLTQSRANALSSDEIEQLKRELAKTPPAELDNALLMAHALAKTQEDAGDYPGALATVAPIKRIAHVEWGEREFTSQFEDARVTFPGPPGELGDSSDTPIFVIGMPRSGTTLAERILCSHALVDAVGETDLFGGAMRSAAEASADQLNVAEIGADYLRRVRGLAGAAAAPRLVDKLPSNFLWAGFIHRALPNARIICMRRSAMDVCVSNYLQYFSNNSLNHGYVFDLADTANYYAAFDRLIAHWREVLPPTRFIELQYEHLVADQEGESRRLLAFCGLDWDPQCLAFHEAPGAVRTASAAQVRKPLYKTAVGRWKRYGAGLQPALNVLARHNIAPDAPPG